ncbi:GNAT family N-acetyltransferase [Saccharothrix hoggarensis]|uniref:GNAT family N-acetyltransferase n=1 Tax=Saccharothrix hoggarensis TaxID=913853 RepID=A0ABW3QQX4_9PSEU
MTVVGDGTVEVFDPGLADEADLAAYYRVVRDSHDEPDEPAPTYDDVVERLRNPFPGVGPAAHWVVREGYGIVAFGYARFPEEENRRLTVATVVVHPDSRRRGVGTRLLRATLPHLRARGRTVIEGWRVPDGGTAARWAHGMGFRTVRVLAVQALTVAEADRSRWPDALPDGYRAVRWVGSAPEDVVASYAAARSAIHDAPTGTTEFRAPEWTVERVRAAEAELRRENTEQRVVVAVHEATGAVVGLTEVVLLPHGPRTSYQGDTAVLAAHRGHGLGLALKGVMAHWLVSDHPDLERMGTVTNADNEHMVRVNHRLGLATVRTELVIAHDIDLLIARLG